jgi:hypothetical protein
MRAALYHRGAAGSTGRASAGGRAVPFKTFESNGGSRRHVRGPRRPRNRSLSYNFFMLGVVVVYAGLLAALAGAVTLVRPLPRLRIGTRKRAAVLLAAGVALFVAGGWLPAPVQRVAAPQTQLDAFMPAWQFGEFHSTRVEATCEAAYRAVREVTAGEIFLFRTLTWIRNPHLPGRGPESILNAPEHKPILDVAQAGGFRLLAEERGKEIVLGTVVLWDRVSRIEDAETFRNFRQPGNALATINFRVQDAGGGCRVTTETRVFATDDAARRQFARYWRVIYPGSSLLRYTWLRAIGKRAEMR